MASDQFADLFSSVTRKKDYSNLSLAERQKLTSNNSSNLQFNRGNQWDDFDILSKAGSHKTTPTGSNNATPSQQFTDLFEGFDVLNSKNNKPTLDMKQNEALYQGFNNTSTKSNPLPQNNDMFDSFDITPSVPTPHSQLSSGSQSQSQDLDDLFAVFDRPPSQPNQSQTIENPVPVHTRSGTILDDNPFEQPQRQAQTQGHRQRQKQPISINDDAKDEAIASLVDMGFSVEQSVDALNHTSTGVNIQEAISYIMNDAHQKARAKAGLPPQSQSERPRHSNQKSPEEYINDLTSMFSSVTTKVASDLQNRFFSPPPPKGGVPAWVRDRDRYKAQSQFDDDPDEIDIESLSKLKIKPVQSHPDDRNDEQLPPRPPRRKHTTQQDEAQPHPPKPITRGPRSKPVRPASAPQSGPEIDLFSSLPPKPQSQPQEEEVDLFTPAPQPEAAKTGLFSDDEMSTSYRRRTPPRPTTGSPKITRSNPPVSATTMEFFKDSREQGGIAFKNGDFTSALSHYLLALESLPERHKLRIIGYSNCIIAYLKVGENKKVIELANAASELIGPDRGVNEDVEEGKPMKDFWVKVTQKKAEALEHLERFREAHDVWLELIENGAASKVAFEGKRRCQEALNPKPKVTPKPTPPKPKPQSQTGSQPAPTSLRKPQPGPRVQDSEALKRVQESNRAAESFEDAKFKLHDQIEAKVNTWKAGKEDNLRALLSSLQNVLWESCNWKPVNISDLVVPRKVKITYMKAVAKVHPDKIPPSATVEQKLVAQSVFVVINQAWETFKSQNGIQ